jgi:hypothetical protein
MRIIDILSEGPFSNDSSNVGDFSAGKVMGKTVPTTPSTGISQKNKDRLSGIAAAADKHFGTNVTGDNAVKSVSSIEQDIERLDIASKQVLLAKLKQDIAKAPADQQEKPDVKTTQPTAKPKQPQAKAAPTV